MSVDTSNWPSVARIRESEGLSLHAVLQTGAKALAAQTAELLAKHCPGIYVSDYAQGGWKLGTLQAFWSGSGTLPPHKRRAGLPHPWGAGNPDLFDGDATDTTDGEDAIAALNALLKRYALKRDIDALRDELTERLETREESGGHVRVVYEMARGEGIPPLESERREHWLLPVVHGLLAAGIPTYLQGEPGSGKTSLALRLAELRGVPATVESGSPDWSESRLTGFLSLVSGEFVPPRGFLSTSAPGVYLLDEVDNCPSAVVAALNAYLAQGFLRLPHGDTLERHEECWILAGGNWSPDTADRWPGREIPDAATFDRFGVLKFDADPAIWYAMAGLHLTGIEPANPLAGGAVEPRKWLQAVFAAREVAKRHNAHYIGQRAVEYGMRAIRAGSVGAVWLAEALLVKNGHADFATECRTTLRGILGLPESNPYDAYSMACAAAMEA